MDMERRRYVKEIKEFLRDERYKTDPEYRRRIDRSNRRFRRTMAATTIIAGATEIAWVVFHAIK